MPAPLEAMPLLGHARGGAVRSTSHGAAGSSCLPRLGRARAGTARSAVAVALRAIAGAAAACALVTAGCGGKGASADAGSSADAQGGNQDAGPGDGGDGGANPDGGDAGFMRLPGFLGPYHPFKGTVYAAPGIAEGTLLDDAFHFGENAILSSPSYGNFAFRENIEIHCGQYDVNRIWGMVLPPSEKGVVNNPADTDLWAPASPPGMIQGAHRYSELSKICPQVTGMIVDDFWRNFRSNAVNAAALRDIKGALLGKPVDENGVVDHDAPATTPDLQLYVVLYETEIGTPNAMVLDQIDGVSFWIYNQERSHSSFDSYMTSIQTRYPGKGIIPGIYVHNSDYGDMKPASIFHLLERSIELHDQGWVTGVLFFAGHWVVTDNISRDRWDALGFSQELDTVYYPFIGGASGQVLDADTGAPVEGALVVVTKHGRDSGFTNLVTRKRTGADGSYRFGGWAGKPGADPFDYDVTVAKGGYAPATTQVRLVGQAQVTAPDVKLRH